MKRLLLSSFLLLFFAEFTFSQKGDDTEFYIFDPSEEAEKIVKEILDAVGSSPNIIIKASNVKNIMSTVQGEKRYILYNTSFLEKIKADANTQWAAYCVIAHEIGHHFYTHDFSETNGTKRKLMELEADRFAGGVLCILGATMDETTAGLASLPLEGETAAFPSKTARLEAIAGGWLQEKERLRRERDSTEPALKKIEAEVDDNMPEREVSNKERVETKTTLSPKIWAVIVGIERYEQAVMPLQYAKSDAYEFSQYLQSVEGLALPKKQVRLLTDFQASKQKILVNLREQFDNAGEEDMVIFYYSGHGAEQAFIPQDYTGSELSKLPHSEIRDIFSKCKAKHKLMISDACYSGSFSGTKDPVSAEHVLNNYNKALLESLGGFAILTSSKDNEVSKEVDGKQQGVFSYYIVKGLSGEADSDGDKIVTITELFSYVYANTQRDTGYRQTPVLSGKYDKNMPIGIIKN